MKQIFLLLVFSGLVLFSKAQFPSFPYSGNYSTGYGQNGAIGTKTGFVYTASFADTTAANAYQVSGSIVGFLKNIAGMVIRCGNSLWMRSTDLQYWSNLNSAWSLNGNSGTDPSVNGIGTTDAQDLKVMTNSVEQIRLLASGGIRIPSSTGSTTGVIFRGNDRFIHSFTPDNNTSLGTSLFIGKNSGNFTMGSFPYGGRNTAVGDSTLFANTTGYRNVAVGIWSMAANTTGFENVALGASSLRKNTTGLQNVAIGSPALESNTTGFSNIAIGTLTMLRNTTGERNTAVGRMGLYENTTGFANAAYGFDALHWNTTGDHNTAIGMDALYYSNGTHNTALGDSTLWGLYPSFGPPNQPHMGYKNVAIGSRAGYHLGDTYPNYASIYDTAVTFLGANASRDSSIAYTTSLQNMTVIGYNARGLASNQVVLGNDDVTSTLLKGAINAKTYGSGTYTGTPTYTLQVDASGNIIEGSITPSVPISSLTSAVAPNTINNGDYAQVWTWDLTGGIPSGLTLVSLGTNISSNDASLQLLSTGTHGGDNITYYGQYIENNADGSGQTNSTNVGLLIASSGAINNYALIVPSGQGSVGIGTSTPNTSSLVDLTSTTKGLLIPRMTTVQQNAIGTPADGLTIYNTDSSDIFVYKSSAWARAGTGGGGGGSGSTNTSIGSGYKVAVDGTNNIKSLTAGWGNILDSTVTGEVRNTVDSNAIKTMIKNDGWYNIVRDGGADTTGVTDVSSIFINAMAAGWRNFFVPHGTFLVSNQIQMKDSTTIMGAGRFASVFKLTTDIAAFKATVGLGGNRTTFSDIGFYGDYATGGLTTQMGISIDSAQGILITNISGVNMGGFVVNILANANCCVSYVSKAGKSNTISDSYFEANYGGVNFGVRAEYNTISNSTFTQNLYAIQSLGGNNRILNNSVENNVWGLYMTSGSNGGHGLASNNTFNHNGTAATGANIYLNGLTLGFNFSNNSFTESQSATAGRFEIISCANITWDGGYTFRDTIRVTASTNIVFNNLRKVAGYTQIWQVVSGDAPIVFNVGDVNNSITLRDVVNSKQLDITHLNGKVNFTGTSGVKFGFLNAAADSTVDITGSLKATGGVRFPGLTTAPGTKALRIDASGNVSMADTTTGGGGITTLNTLTGATQTFSGSGITIASSGTNHAFTNDLTSGKATAQNIYGTTTSLAGATGLTINSTTVAGSANKGIIKIGGFAAFDEYYETVGIGLQNSVVPLHIKGSSTAYNGLKIENTNSSSYARQDWVNDNGDITQMLLTGSLYNSGIFTPNSASFYNAGSGGTNIGAAHASGIIRFFTNGYTTGAEKWRISAAGNLSNTQADGTEALHITGNIKGSGFIELSEIAAPSTPGAALSRIYVKSDGLFYGKDDAGVETKLSNVAVGSGITFPQAAALSVIRF